MFSIRTVARIRGHKRRKLIQLFPYFASKPRYHADFLSVNKFLRHETIAALPKAKVGVNV